MNVVEGRVNLEDIAFPALGKDIAGDFEKALCYGLGQNGVAVLGDGNQVVLKVKNAVAIAVQHKKHLLTTKMQNGIIVL